MNLLKDEAATGRQRRHLPTHLRDDVVGGAARQDVLRLETHLSAVRGRLKETTSELARVRSEMDTTQQKSAAIVASTLLIAALFSPLRRRLQDLIDRRFYRRTYDTAQTLAQFNRVTQKEVELARLTTELLSVVQQTMQPEHLSVWLQEQDHHRPDE